MCMYMVLIMYFSLKLFTFIYIVILYDIITNVSNSVYFRTIRSVQC